MADLTFLLSDSVVSNKHFASDAAVEASKLARRSQARVTVPLEKLVTWDALATNLPNTSSADDLGLVTGTWGSAAPYVGTSDLKSAGATTRYAGFLIPMPPDYEDGETVTLRVTCGMKTTVADTSCSIDAECYALDVRQGALVSGDLVSTAAQSMNSLTAASKDFAIDESGLVAGQMISVRLKITCTDAAGLTAVIAAIWQVEVLCDLR